MARVLTISNFYPPHHHGGYELACRDVMEAWKEHGHDVTVLASSRLREGVDGGDPPDGSVRRQLPSSFDGQDFVLPPLHRRLAFERRSLAVLEQTMADCQPDVVSVWHMAGLSFGLLSSVLSSGTPMVCVVCDEWPCYITSTDAWMRLWRRAGPHVRKRVELVLRVPSTVPNLGRSASFCFTSHHTRDRCLKASPWMFPRSTVTYLGIDTDDFPVTRTRTNRPWSGRIVTAGRLDPRKGFATAISALAQLPAETTLDVLSAADGPYRHELEALAARLGVSDRVSFGIKDRAGLRRSYLDADAVVFPSEWTEPFGLVPIEAMACGAPVVATGTGGSGEFLVDERTCLRFEPGDAAGLAGAVQRLSGSAELRSRLVEAGWGIAEELTAARMATALEEWHLAAIDGFAGGAPPPRDVRPYRASLLAREA